MSAKILQFRPKPDNKLYRKYSYTDFLKMSQENFNNQEKNILEQLGFKYDEKENYFFEDTDFVSSAFVEKRNGLFFYIEPAPIGICFIDFQNFSNLETLKSYISK